MDDFCKNHICLSTHFHTRENFSFACTVIVSVEVVLQQISVFFRFEWIENVQDTRLGISLTLRWIARREIFLVNCFHVCKVCFNRDTWFRILVNIRKSYNFVSTANSKFQTSNLFFRCFYRWKKLYLEYFTNGPDLFKVWYSVTNADVGTGTAYIPWRMEFDIQR